MDAADRRAFAAQAQKFGDAVVAPMVGTEGRDGDLDRLDAVLAQAGEIGLLAAADPDAAGHEYGVWGRAALEHGPAASLAMIEALARSCPGVAAAVAFGGLGALGVRDLAPPPGRAAAVLLSARSALGDLELTGDTDADSFAAWLAAGAASLTADGQGVRLDLRAETFVLAPPGVTAFVVFANGPQGWARVLVPAGAAAKRVAPADRMGLAACDLYALPAGPIPVAAADEQVRAGADPAAHLRRLWWSLAAIAVGNAAAALDAAHAYARERYQGGRLIDGHAAVQLLLGRAASRVAVGRAALADATAEGGVTSLRRAAMVKVEVLDACARAVSDCLQVLGGYGYMEDYRLEKRLRDALTLKSLAGRPDDLLRLIAASDGEGAA